MSLLSAAFPVDDCSGFYPQLLYAKKEGQTFRDNRTVSTTSVYPQRAKSSPSPCRGAVAETTTVSLTDTVKKKNSLCAPFGNLKLIILIAI